MIGYVTLGAKNFDDGVQFYDAVLGTLGWKRFVVHGKYAGYGPGGDGSGQTVWVCEPFNGEPAVGGNGVMLAFKADSHDQVHAFYDAAMAKGAADEGPPGPRPDYTPTWYAAYLRDPTGNKIAIFTAA